jgi:translation initiation factor IF-2
MAKKRVHEIAKSQGMTSKEVLAKLQAAGLEVKAAASSVEESDALKVLNGGNGAAPAEQPAPAATRPAAAAKPAAGR